VRTTQRSSTPEEDRKRLLILVAIAASGLLALALVVAFLAFGTSDDGGAGGNGGDGSFAAEMRDAGYTYKTYPAMKNLGNHTDVPSVDTKVQWNSNPPTSGPHYGQWAVWNFYDSAVPLTMSTHNLEHGGIVIHYGPQLPASELSKLRSFYNDDPNAMLVAPLASAGNKVIASAWFYDESKGRDNDDYRGVGEQITGTKVDEGALAAFRDEFRYKGRERIPAENLQPGM
jgi:Protein of unknown function (DUF3105)